MKNIKKIIIPILCIVFVVVVYVSARDLIFNNENIDENNIGITEENSNDNNDNSNSIELVEAKVTKVVDGDTILVDILGEEYKVRFIGIDCPEYTKEIEPYGKEATEYTKNNLENSTVYLQKDISDTDNYDRLLRYVWTEKIDTVNEENISNYLFNAKLVEEGLAESNYYKPNITYQNYLENIEKKAKEENIGMWQ